MDAAAPGVAQNVGMYQRIRARLPALRPPVADVVLAAAFSVAAVAAAAAGLGSSDGDRTPLDLPPGLLPGNGQPFGPPDADPLVALASLLVTAPLAWRRRAPIGSSLVVFLGSVVVRNGNTFVTFAAALFAVYSLGVHGRRPMLSIALLVAMATGLALAFNRITPPVPDWATPFVLLLPIGLLGTTVRAARARADASAERARAVEHEQHAMTRAAVAEERSRIARDLHDVVSHHVSVMVIQAGAAGKVVDERPDLARGSLDAIADSGRAAMAELRHLLGVLAATADGEPPLHPQPGLDQLDALVANVRAAGQPVTVSRSGAAPSWGVGQVAYRVVQEALTNALRYAPGARTEVAIAATPEGLVVEVTNDEPAAPVPPRGAGSGLLGLAERLRLYGGTLDAGRRLVGGFRVRAMIPIEPS
jgi:signal transduction histidine kinase